MKYTVIDFHNQFGTEEQCLNYLFQKRFGDKACPKCGNSDCFYKVKGRKVFACSCGKHQICPTADTIFHKSRTRLYLWFYAIFLFAQSKNGVSGKELERQLGVTYKTAWRMAKQIRALMSDDNEMKLVGTVEADETYVGGKGSNNKRGRGAENKTPVFGIVERQGNVRAYAVDNVKMSTIRPIMRENIELGANVMTDEFNIYNRVSEDGFIHEKINHGRKEYVFGDVYTNTIEGFWSQLKRGVDGTYHAISPKYLQDYINEFAFRWNHRNSPQHHFEILMGRV